jgi:hypothetical protein
MCVCYRLRPGKGKVASLCITLHQCLQILSELFVCLPPLQRCEFLEGGSCIFSSMLPQCQESKCLLNQVIEEKA